MKKLHGDVLLGFSDFFAVGESAPTSGLQVRELLGAARPKTPPKGPGAPPPRKGPKTIKPAPRVPYGKIEQKGAKTVSEHAKVMKQAHATLNKAARALTGKRGGKVAAKPAARGRVVVGTYEELVALGVTPKKLSPRASALLKKRDDIKKQVDELDRKLKAKAETLKPQLKKLAKALVNQKKAALALRKPRRTAMGYYVLGADPTDDTSIADATADTGGDAAATSDMSASDILDLLDSGTLPPASNFPPDFVFDDYKKYYGFLYNGEKGRPNGYVLSYGLATRATDESKMDPDSAQIDGYNHFGFAWGVYDLLGPEKGIRWGSHFTPDKWNHVHGAFHLGWDSDWHEVVDESFVLSHTPNTKAGEFFAGARGRPPGAKVGASYGPLVGNPAMPDFKGMRVDSKGNMFWLPQEAPEWLLAPIRMAVAATKAAEEKARKAAEEADRLAEEKDKKQRDLEKADAELAADKEVAAARGETAKAEGAAATAQAESLKTAGEQQKLDVEQQRAMFEIMKQQMAAMPPMPMAYPMAPMGPQAEDEYAPEQPAYDDGEAVPGADIMQDADGAGYGQFESDEE